MTIADMLGQSGVLTILGMGVVFGFLVILVISVTIMGKVIHALGADRDLAASPPPSGGTASPARAGVVTAVISAAVTEYRKNG